METTGNSTVNHPSHYQMDGGLECIDVMRMNFGIEAVYDFCLLNAFKYLSRCNKKHKTPIEDLKKARYYLDYIIKNKEAVDSLQDVGMDIEKGKMTLRADSDEEQVQAYKDGLKRLKEQLNGGENPQSEFHNADLAKPHGEAVNPYSVNIGNVMLFYAADLEEKVRGMDAYDADVFKEGVRWILSKMPEEFDKFKWEPITDEKKDENGKE